jgi:hypothetical protein
MEKPEKNSYLKPSQKFQPRNGTPSISWILPWRTKKTKESSLQRAVGLQAKKKETEEVTSR